MKSWIEKYTKKVPVNIKGSIPFISIGILFCLAAAVVMVVNGRNPVKYTMYNIETISYEKGKVTEVLEEHVEPAPDMPGRVLGQQTIRVRLRQGPLKGTDIELINNLSNEHNILVKQGQRVIIKADRPEDVEPYYTLYNYDRTPGLIIVILFFAGLMIAVGRIKGLRSVLGLGISLFFILAFLLPAIFRGDSPVLMSIITVIMIAGFSVVLLNGFSEKTIVALSATVTGILLTGLFFAAISKLLTLVGYNIEEAGELILVSRATGLKIGDVLFAGVLVSSLGAVMDMSISISAAMYELKENQPEISPIDWFRSGMTVGRDMIGAMCQTLIMAFVGSSIATLLTLMAYGTQFNQLMSSDYIAIEVAHGITGSLTVIIAVPVTAGLCMLFGKNIRKKQESSIIDAQILTR